MSSILNDVETTFQNGDIEALKRWVIDELQKRDIKINNLQNLINDLGAEIAFLHNELKHKANKVDIDDFEFQMKTIYGN